MYVIGLTGGVGSGKSYVAQKLKKLCNAKLLIADKLGHIVMKSGTPCFDRIVEAFGQNILGKNGEIDKKYIADIIFKDSNSLKTLNGIVHPEVIDYITKYIDKMKEKHGIIILETAIMYECGCDRLCDEVWYVYTPADIRIKRLSETRGYSMEKSKAIISKQKSDEYFMQMADKIIKNVGTFEALQAELLLNINKLPQNLIM